MPMLRLLISIFWLIALTASAHPGIGIVRDSRGTIYYTDLVHVWKITPDRKAGLRNGQPGQKRVAVRNVHTHELALDAQDNLYGEHLWYEGEVTDKWGHYVWRLCPAGQLTKVIPDTPGFLTNYSFVRDRAGAMYWVERGTPCRFMKKMPDGTIRQLATGTFADVRWQYITPDGQLYFVNDNDLYQLSTHGVIKQIRANLDGVTTATSGHNHSIQGIWSDSRGNVYVAVASKRNVQRISPDGRLTTVVTSPYPWAPSGGLIAPDGALWLLEFNPNNEVRVRVVR